MFRKTLPLYIDALLIKKDKEIEDIFFQIHDLFIKFCHNGINKEYLLDEHTHRKNYLLNGVKFTNIKISPYNILWKNIFTLKIQMNATSATINIMVFLNVNAVFLGAVQNVLIIFIF